MDGIMIDGRKKEKVMQLSDEEIAANSRIQNCPNF
jgi:hypothetical protein